MNENLKIVVKTMVNEIVEDLLEGGPGSGRYPRGSGKNPDADGDKLPNLKVRRGDFESARDKAEMLTKKAEQEGTYHSHKQAQRVHERASRVAELQGRDNAAEYHWDQATSHRRTADAVRRAERDKAKETETSSPASEETPMKGKWRASDQAAEPDVPDPNEKPHIGGSAWGKDDEPLLKSTPHDAKDKDLLKDAINRETQASYDREKQPAKEKPHSAADDRAGPESYKHSHSEKADRITKEMRDNKKIQVVFNPNDNSIEIHAGRKRSFSMSSAPVIRYRNQTAEDASKIYDELSKRVGGKKSLTLSHVEPKEKSEARFRRKLAKFGLRYGG